MSVNLQGRSLLTLKDFSASEILHLLELAKQLKQKKKSGNQEQCLRGKNIVLLFAKPSTRTHCAFAVAAFDEGACVTHLIDSHVGYKESIADTAKFLGSIYDGIEYRGFLHQEVELLAQYAGVPVWNGLTDLYHPTQALADILTIVEKIPKPLTAVKLVYVGDARNNVANSLLVISAKLGMHFVALAPPSLQPNHQLYTEMQAEALRSGARIEVTSDIDQAVADADVLYTDVWVSMGEEATFADRIELLLPYQINEQMLQKTGNADVKFMHCLPAFHDTNTAMGQKIQQQFGLTAMEVTDEVFTSAHSLVFVQAENRMHTIKAVMVATIGIT